VDARIATGDLALQSLLRQLRLKTLSEESVRRYAPALVNVNTPAELEQARRQHGHPDAPTR
jgi:molybdopterin-guanine dinucleotide biosynthesis protein A